MWRSLNVEEIEMMLRVEHSSIYRILLPLDPKVKLVGWVSSTDVSEGIMIICADWMNVRLIVYLEVKQT